MHTNSLTFTHFHSLSLTFTHFHSLTLTFAHFHSRTHSLTFAQAVRKRNLEMVVEGQQEQLSGSIITLEKRVDKIAEAGSLIPSDVQVLQ